MDTIFIVVGVTLLGCVAGFVLGYYHRKSMAASCDKAPMIKKVL